MNADISGYEVHTENYSGNIAVLVLYCLLYLTSLWSCLDQVSNKYISHSCPLKPPPIWDVDMLTVFRFD